MKPLRYGPKVRKDIHGHSMSMKDYFWPKAGETALFSEIFGSLNKAQTEQTGQLVQPMNGQFYNANIYIMG